MTGPLLNPTDLAMFARFGITPEVLAEAHVQRVTDAEARNDFGINGTGDRAGIIFPYFSPETGYRTTARLRLDHPPIENGKPKNKYLCPFGDRRHLYFPSPQSHEALADKSTPVILVEAEKSALALTAWAARTGKKVFAAATGGCWSWRGKTGKAETPDGTYADEVGPLPDLVTACTGRTVFILFDSNATSNPKVRAARFALVEALQGMQAHVQVLNLPEMENANGPDDFLMLAGDDALSKLFEAPAAVHSEVSPYSDDDLATRFTAAHGSDLRFTAETGRWNLWNGKFWEEDRAQIVHDLARGICRAAAKELDTIKLGKGRTIASHKTARAAVALASSDSQHAITADEWDANSMLLNCGNGAIDLRTGELLAHDRKFHTTKITATDFAATPTPLWNQFLKRVTANNAELENYLQRVAGYCLTGSTVEQCFFFAYGTGANGKSVFANTLTGILGPYSTTAPIETFLASNLSQHPCDLASLRGARLVSSVETERDRRWAESRLKTLTGCDRIAARFMRQDFFEFTPQFKLLIFGNHKPGLRSVDEAIRRRLHLIPFTVQIPAHERDPHLMEKLKAEWPGILAWAVAGCLEWQRVGLNPPPVVRDATESYLEEENRVAHWADCNCERDAQAFTPVSVLYSNWKSWAESNGEFVLSRKSFSQTLGTIPGVSKDRTSAARGFFGIRLKPWDQREHAI